MVKEQNKDAIVNGFLGTIRRVRAVYSFLKKPREDNLERRVVDIEFKGSEKRNVKETLTEVLENLVRGISNFKGKELTLTAKERYDQAQLLLEKGAHVQRILYWLLLFEEKMINII